MQELEGTTKRTFANKADMQTKTLAHEPIENVEKGYAGDDYATTFTADEQKRIIRRIDIRLVVTLGCLYCISLLDRTNLGAATVAGYSEPQHISTQLN